MSDKAYLAALELVESLKAERDAAIKRAQVAEDERDAVSSKCAEFKQDGEQWKSAHDEVAACEQVLAAHVERLHAKIDECYGDPGRMHLEAGNIRDQGPQTSLSLLKAQWQAEALEAMAARLWPVGMIGKGVERDAILLRAEELRRQAEADQ